MNTASRLYDKSPYDGIAHEVCLTAVAHCDTLLQIFTDPVLGRKHGIDPVRAGERIPRLKKLRDEWQAAADRKMYQLIVPGGK